MELADDGAYVAMQMWAVVSKTITYSCTMMSKLFDTVGATVDERSPFCRSFSSPADLRNEFMRYLPRTFQYKDVMGDGVEEPTVEPEDTNTPSKDIMVDRIRRFASEMNKAEEEDNEGDDDNEDVVSASSADDTSAADATDNSQELMNLFQGIIDTSSVDDILGKVLAASACLEQKNNIRGASNIIRKGKSLV